MSKFEIGDRVICVAHREDYDIVQIGWTGIVQENSQVPDVLWDHSGEKHHMGESELELIKDDWAPLQRDNLPADILTWRIGVTHEMQVYDHENWRPSEAVTTVILLGGLIADFEYRYRVLPQKQSLKDAVEIELPTGGDVKLKEMEKKVIEHLEQKAHEAHLEKLEKPLPRHSAKSAVDVLDELEKWLHSEIYKDASEEPAWDVEPHELQDEIEKLRAELEGKDE